ncbi:cytochrome P450 [Stachybotrys elegans]|uniref:Cytochrome P450 n=1 Tax=Stachybotrys elegans TaxID=80388 RepID=A0A8K0WJE1_9HYPO|nr:cytochrome P450 [Stachybotrys elegans]
MALLKTIVGGVLLLTLTSALHTAYGLLRNYRTARKIGVPTRIILFDHVNPLWLVCDRAVLSFVKRLPFGLGDNSFTRYNFRGWEVPDRYYSHRDMGDAYILVSSKNIWLYVADPDTITDIWRRASEFPRDVSVTAILNIFGPNISTTQGQQWQKHRRVTASSFNDQNNALVWAESITVAHDMLRYWSTKPSLTTAADDLRTLSLHVMSRAGFGKSFKFQGHDERETLAEEDLSLSYKDSLKLILENCVIIFALGTNFLSIPYLPKKLRQLHKACTSFQNYMTQLYEEEKLLAAQGQSADRNFMTSLVRASQSSSFSGLTESEIYGNIFTFNFAGHDTTAHTFTFAIYFLSANPDVQDWLHEEINHVLGHRQPEEWQVLSDFPRLKRCLAVLYETLRLYTPVPTSKFVDSNVPLSIKVNNETLILPPKTMVVPSYASLQTDPKYWGDNSLEWKPSRFIKGAGLDSEQFMLPERGIFLPWSGGPRDCIGRKFSQVEFVAVMASLFRQWRVDPVLAAGETAEVAHKRILNVIEMDSAPVLLLQMLHPERVPLTWSRRQS